MHVNACPANLQLLSSSMYFLHSSTTWWSICLAYQPSRFLLINQLPRSPNRGNINCSGQNGCCLTRNHLFGSNVLLWVAISISTNAESIGGSQNLRWFIQKMHQKHVAGPNNSKIFQSRESFRTIWMTWHPTPPTQGFLTSDVQELHWRQCVDPGHRYRLLGQGYSKWDDPFMSSGRHQTTSSNFMKTYYLRTSMQLGSWLLYRTPPPPCPFFAPLENPEVTAGWGISIHSNRSWRRSWHRYFFKKLTVIQTTWNTLYMITTDILCTYMIGYLYYNIYVMIYVYIGPWSCWRFVLEKWQS